MGYRRTDRNIIITHFVVFVVHTGKAPAQVAVHLGKPVVSTQPGYNSRVKGWYRVRDEVDGSPQSLHSM